MIKEGQIVLFSFPRTDQASGKLRPALVLRRCPGAYDDWLISMVSSQLRQTISGVDEIINPEDNDFPQTGLKLASVVRDTRGRPEVLGVKLSRLLISESISGLRLHRVPLPPSPFSGEEGHKSIERSA